MAAKILAGLLAALAVTGIGIYAATGTVPGVETLAEQISGPAPKSACGQVDTGCGLEAVSKCSMSAVTCPDESATTDDIAAVTGGPAVVASEETPEATPATGCCPNK